MGLARSLVGRTLAAALALLFLLSLAASSSAAPPPSRGRKLGFFYTRTRGRCTPQYWSSGREKWPRMVPRKSTVSRAFGSRAIAERYGGDLTVWESTAGAVGVGGAYGRLVKQASAALLNSYARKGFAYSAWEVKTLLIQALASPRAAADQADQFAVANEACVSGGPIRWSRPQAELVFDKNLGPLRLGARGRFDPSSGEVANASNVYLVPAGTGAGTPPRSSPPLERHVTLSSAAQRVVVVVLGGPWTKDSQLRRQLVFGWAPEAAAVGKERD